MTIIIKGKEVEMPKTWRLSTLAFVLNKHFPCKVLRLKK